MNNQVTISKENILNAYNQASGEQKALLENMFGKDIFQPKDIRERIKTFHDAYCELGNEHPFVKSYEKYVNTASGEEIDIIAYLKLRIICAALNEGWKPKFTEDERHWYPWFILWTEDELKADKKLRVFCGRSDNAGRSRTRSTRRALLSSQRSWPNTAASNL